MSTPDSVEMTISQSLYQELRNLARKRLRSARFGQSLQPTELVHEVYERFARRKPQFANRRHLLGVAARAMRDVMVEHMRRKLAKKRGGDQVRVDIDISLQDGTPLFSLDRVIDLHESLAEFECHFPEHAEIVRLRYFAGMLNREIAELVETSERSVEKKLQFARTWLRKCMTDARAEARVGDSSG